MDKPIPEAVVTDKLIEDLLPRWLIFAETAEHLAHARQRAKTILLKAPAAAQQRGQAVASENVRRLVGSLDQWRPCMSHNESYFGEPAGLVKSVSEELARAVDPIYPPKPEPIDPLERVTIHTVTIPLSPLTNGRCHCDPSGVDGLTCPDETGRRLCCATAPTDEPNPPTSQDRAYAEAVKHSPIAPHSGALTAAQQPDHIVDATKMVAQQQGQAVAWMTTESIAHLAKQSGPAKVDAWNCSSGAERVPVYTAPPSAPVGVDGTWLWGKLMDWCREQRIAPATQDKLFAIAGEAHRLNALAQQPAAVDRRHPYVQSKDHGGCANCGYPEWEPWHALATQHQEPTT